MKRNMLRALHSVQNLAHSQEPKLSPLSGMQTRPSWHCLHGSAGLYQVSVQQQQVITQSHDKEHVAPSRTVPNTCRDPWPVVGPKFKAESDACLALSPGQTFQSPRNVCTKPNTRLDSFVRSMLQSLMVASRWACKARSSFPTCTQHGTSHCKREVGALKAHNEVLARLLALCAQPCPCDSLDDPSSFSPWQPWQRMQSWPSSRNVSWSLPSTCRSRRRQVSP